MKPLAFRYRPTSFEDLVGNKNLIGKEGILQNMLKQNKILSFVLYGPSGTGKTSIALLFTKLSKKPYKILNAATCSKQEIKDVIELAKLHEEYLLIIDEIHRLNKSNQDFLLPYIEDGSIKIIGLTTTNPYYSINSALRSRLQLFEVERLNKEDISKALEKVAISEKIEIEKEASLYLSSLSNGDLRYALNLLEMLTLQDDKITCSRIKEIDLKPHIKGGNDTDEHYDLLSALQKSIRGSDVNASLYYLGRLLFIGDIEALKRRLIVISYEDIGLANPNISIKLKTALDSLDIVGLPEGRIILGSVVIEMALSPKSNSQYLAINKVFNDLEHGLFYPVPGHILTSSPLYKYPHDYKNHLVKQAYLPEELKDKIYYNPNSLGYEKHLLKLDQYLKDFQNSKTDK